MPHARSRPATQQQTSHLRALRRGLGSPSLITTQMRELLYAEVPPQDKIHDAVTLLAGAADHPDQDPAAALLARYLTDQQRTAADWHAVVEPLAGRLRTTRLGALQRAPFVHALSTAPWNAAETTAMFADAPAASGPVAHALADIACRDLEQPDAGPLFGQSAETILSVCDHMHDTAIAARITEALDRRLAAHPPRDWPAVLTAARRSDALPLAHRRAASPDVELPGGPAPDDEHTRAIRAQRLQALTAPRWHAQQTALAATALRLALRVEPVTRAALPDWFTGEADTLSRMPATIDAEALSRHLRGMFVDPRGAPTPRQQHPADAEMMIRRLSWQVIAGTAHRMIRAMTDAQLRTWTIALTDDDDVAASDIRHALTLYENRSVADLTGALESAFVSQQRSARDGDTVEDLRANAIVRLGEPDIPF